MLDKLRSTKHLVNEDTYLVAIDNYLALRVVDFIVPETHPASKHFTFNGKTEALEKLLCLFKLITHLDAKKLLVVNVSLP